MLSDVLVPMLDLTGGADPVGDYLAALDRLETVAPDVDVVIPGHGSVGGADQTRVRAELDRAYVRALRDNQGRAGPTRGSARRPSPAGSASGTRPARQVTHDERVSPPHSPRRGPHRVSLESCRYGGIGGFGGVGSIFWWG